MTDKDDGKLKANDQAQETPNAQEKPSDPPPVYELFDTDIYKKKHGNITIYREDVFAQEVNIQELQDFSLATFLMSNRIGLWIPKGNFDDSMHISWKVVPIKVKRIKRDGKREIAVEAVFVGLPDSRYAKLESQHMHAHGVIRRQER